MDSILIRDLRVETVVGIYDWERRIRQIVSLDLDMSTDIRRAAGSDRIEDTLDYKAVAKRVAQFVSAAQFQLVETLAEKIAALVLDEFKVTQVKVTRTDAPCAIRDRGQADRGFDRGEEGRQNRRHALPPG